jgi:hypothetical protein
VATRGAPTMPFREEPVGGRHEGGRESESLQPHGAPSGGGGVRGTDKPTVTRVHQQSRSERNLLEKW